MLSSWLPYYYYFELVIIKICYISDESSKLKHDAPGLLTMAIADRDSRGSLFNVTFGANRHLDRFAHLCCYNFMLDKLIEIATYLTFVMVTYCYY